MIVFDRSWQTMAERQVSYSYYESGKREVPVEVLVRLAEFYHTSADYLIRKTDVKTPYPSK